jgi:low affinity Fe/Cu permease
MGGIRPASRFGHFSKWIARAVGQPVAFGGACALIILWLLSGPIFGFSDTWQLIINPGTTIVTFLMVFLIQNTQNRDAEAMHIKLDELIRAVDNAQNALLNLEELEEKDLDRIRAEYLNLAEQSRHKLKSAGLNNEAEEADATNGSSIMSRA